MEVEVIAGAENILQKEDLIKIESELYFENLENRQLEFRCVLAAYLENNGFVKDSDQKTVAFYVIENELNKDPKAVISTPIFQKLESYLIIQFPTTEPGTWFCKSSGGKNSNGKLYDSYNDWKLKLRAANLRDIEKKPAPKKPRTENKQPDQSIEIEELSLNRLTDCMNINNTSQVKIDWEITYQRRRHKLVICEASINIFEKYPAYKCSPSDNTIKYYSFENIPKYAIAYNLIYKENYIYLNYM